MEHSLLPVVYVPQLFIEFTVYMWTHHQVITDALVRIVRASGTVDFPIVVGCLEKRQKHCHAHICLLPERESAKIKKFLYMWQKHWVNSESFSRLQYASVALDTPVVTQSLLNGNGYHQVHFCIFCHFIGLIRLYIVQWNRFDFLSIHIDKSVFRSKQECTTTDL